MPNRVGSEEAEAANDQGERLAEIRNIIKCLEEPKKHQLKYLSNRVQLGNILIIRAKDHQKKMNLGTNETTKAGIEAVESEHEHDKATKEIFKTFSSYLTTLMVVAALVLTISIPWLFTTVNKTSVYDDFYNDDILRVFNSVMVISMMCSSMFSTITLVVAIVFHVNINLVMTSTEDQLWFISEHYVGVCEDLLITSAVFLTFSMPFGIFVAYGKLVAYICAGIFASTILSISVFSIYLTQSLTKRLHPKFVNIAGKFTTALKELENPES